MPRPQLILPRADAACGKIFFADRRTADGHRIALEVWNRATGRVREGYRLDVYRCKRCAGYHICHRPVEQIRIRTLAVTPDDVDREDEAPSGEWGADAPRVPEEEAPFDDWGGDTPRVRRAALFEPAWS